MKKIFAIFTFFAFFLDITNSTAQESTPKYMIGGNINASYQVLSTSVSNSPISNISFSSRIGRVFGHWTMGVDVVLSGSKSEFGLNIDQSINFGGGVFSRYTKRINDLMGIWGEAQTGGTRSKQAGRNKTNLYYANLRPGVIFFVGKHLSLECSVGILGFHQSANNLSDPTQNNRSTTGGLTLGANSIIFGINCFL